jgi:indole-3-glycerol phosphate synthase/phosphoribosylanthranilate isomerase
MASILDDIVVEKRKEIEVLYAQHNLDTLRQTTTPTKKDFYSAVAQAKIKGSAFFICEFKRKSPSEGWINRDANIEHQVTSYAQAGAGAVSVLTDTPFFGGTYDDLRTVATLLADTPVLALQKDFILDPIQIYLARQAGADMILLIAAILEPDELENLRQTAASLGMGALVEVHDAEELAKIQHLPFPVLGVNNRDLKTFRTALNRVNVLARQAGARMIISESGIRDYRDFLLVRRADGFLIGTGLMQHSGAMQVVDGNMAKLPALFKACGIRTAEAMAQKGADYIGINFSPVSKRRMSVEVLDEITIPSNAVAVFYQNTEAEIQAILKKYPFKIVQLYAGDVSPDFVRSLRHRVFMAGRIGSSADLAALEVYAADIDLFILDGTTPGSGQQIVRSAIPTDFPFPFLLAGGIRTENAASYRLYANCVGVDVASGIENEGAVDLSKILSIRQAITA